MEGSRLSLAETASLSEPFPGASIENGVRSGEHDSLWRTATMHSPHSDGDDTMARPGRDVAKDMTMDCRSQSYDHDMRLVAFPESRRRKIALEAA